jgi:hypothetical protein
MVKGNLQKDELNRDHYEGLNKKGSVELSAWIVKDSNI